MTATRRSRITRPRAAWARCALFQSRGFSNPVSSSLGNVRRTLRNRGFRSAIPARRLIIKLAGSNATAAPFLRQLATLYRPTAPTFIILGTQKGGTTSLWHYLSQHPAVTASYSKEIHFFDLEYSKGLPWYLAHFPPARNTPCVTGEASPYYMFHPHVPGRIAQTVPDARLIVLLRNPIDRAYSHYQHNVRAGREPLPFAEAIEREPRRLQGEVEKLLENDRYSSYNHRHYSYLARGIYVEQIKSIHRFFPRDQVLILKSEDLFSDPQSSYRLALEHLGLPRRDLTAYEQLNSNSYETFDPEMRRLLHGHFKPYNEMLYAHLGRDFGWEQGSP